jgi:hypothetical protein
MAKKNRAPRPKIDDLYLCKGEIIPGVWDSATQTPAVADKDSWYTPELMDGFNRVKYRKWKQEMIAKWRESDAQDAP